MNSVCQFRGICGYSFVCKDDGSCLVGTKNWENQVNRKVMAYLSHSIRGSKGKDATAEDTAKNCQKALEAANWVRSNVPGLDLYVPAEHEEFVQQAYEKGYLSIEQILVVDCDIVAKKDLLLVYSPDGWVGGGIGREIQCAQKLAKFIFFVRVLDEPTAISLRTLVTTILVYKTGGKNE